MMLSESPPGKKVRVKAIHGGRGMLMRLSAMGIREGDVLLVVSRLPMGPVIVEHAVHGHRVIVGHGMASRIEVVPE